jgi:beta-lactamase regulating signal transducer with metallopeptidase domain
VRGDSLDTIERRFRESQRMSMLRREQPRRRRWTYWLACAIIAIFVAVAILAVLWAVSIIDLWS